MIDLREAIEIAEDYYEKSKEDLVVNKILENDSMFIFFAKGRNENKTYIGSNGISINKENGEMKNFFLPNKENFEILHNSKHIDINDLMTTEA